LTVFLIEAEVNIPFLGYNVVNGYHIHHFTYGIILLVLLAFYSLFFRMNRVRDVYLMFGLALGLIFDEFGIWLKLDPEYNQNVSYVAMGIVFLILSMIVLLGVKFPVSFGNQEKPDFDEVDV
jgi:prepilin signal peptidase PulO-like enzyme (type II secretory pathway)